MPYSNLKEWYKAVCSDLERYLKHVRGGASYWANITPFVLKYVHTYTHKKNKIYFSICAYIHINEMHRENEWKGMIHQREGNGTILQEGFDFPELFDYFTWECIQIWIFLKELLGNLMIYI